MPLRGYLSVQGRSRHLTRGPTDVPSRRAGSARHNFFIELLIYDLDRAVDLGIGYAKLVRNQLHQQVDPLNERR